MRGGGEATERVLAVLRAQVVTFAEEVAAGALLEELAAKVVDAALEELPSAPKKHEAAEDVRKFLEELATDYEHEESAHKHDNGACRRCNAVRLLKKLEQRSEGT